MPNNTAINKVHIVGSYKPVTNSKGFETLPNEIVQGDVTWSLHIDFLTPCGSPMFTDDFQRMCRDLRVLVVAPYDIRNLQDLLHEYHLDAEMQLPQVKIICLLAVHQHAFANPMSNVDPHRLIFHSRQNNEVTTTHYDPEAVAEYCGQHGIEALPCDQETLANVGRLKTCLLEKFERCINKEDAAAAAGVEKPASGSAHNRFRLCPPPGHKSSKPRFPVSTKPPCSIL